MSVAVCLLLYGAVVCVTAPRLVPHLTRGGNAPRAAVAVWLAVVASVLGSWAAAAAALVVYVAQTWDRLTPSALASCLAEIRSAAAGSGGPAIQVGLLSSAVVLSAMVVVLSARMVRSLLRIRARTRQHAQSARIIGRRVAGVKGVVVDAPQKMAYCLGGRPGTVVITSAAVAALERRELDAVLAHEEAHLAGRHHVLLGVTRAVATSLPQIRLFSVAHTEVRRLLEICADDTAARCHGTAALLSALLTLAGAGPVPAPALAASTVGISARVSRLTRPDTTPRRLSVDLLLTASSVLLVVAPVLGAWAAASGYAACGPFIS